MAELPGVFGTRTPPRGAKRKPTPAVRPKLPRVLETAAQEAKRKYPTLPGRPFNFKDWDDAKRHGRLNDYYQAHLDEIKRLPPSDQATVSSEMTRFGTQEKALGLVTVAPEHVTSYVGEQLHKAGRDIYGIPGGLIHLATQSPVKSAKELAAGTVETVKHPARDVFATATLAGAAATAPASVAGRVAAVSTALRAGARVGTVAEAGGLGRALTSLSAKERRAYAVLKNPEKHLAKGTLDEPTARVVAAPTPRLGRLLNADAELRAARTELLDQLGKGTVAARKVPAVRKPAAAAREIGHTQAARVAKAAIRTPEPPVRTLTVPGAEGEGLKIHPIASKNPLVAQIQTRVVDPRRQRRLTTGKKTVGETVAEAAGPKATTGYAKMMGTPDARVGAQLRARRRIVDAIEMAPAGQVARYAPGTGATGRAVTTLTRGRVVNPRLLPKKLRGRRLTAAQQKAFALIKSGEGPQAHILLHENRSRRMGVSAKEVRDHRREIALTKAAIPYYDALKAGTAHPKLQQALEETRALSQKGERVKGMTEEAVAHRVGAEAEEIRAGAQGRQSPFEHLQGLEQDLARLSAGKPTPRLRERQLELERATKGRLRGLFQQQAAMARAEQKATSREFRLKTTRRPEEKYAVEKVQETFRESETAYRKRRQLRDELARTRVQLDRARESVVFAQVRHAEGTHPYSHVQGRLAKVTQLQAKEKALGDALRREVRAAEQTTKKHEVYGQLQKAEEASSEQIARSAGMARISAAGMGKALEQEIERVRGTHARLKEQLTPEAEAERVSASVEDVHRRFTERGKQAIDEGAFYVPSRERGFFTKVGPRSRRPSEYGIGPQGSHPAFRHRYTGALKRTGRERSDVTRLAVESYTQAQRYAAIDRALEQLQRTARDTKEEAGGDLAVPLRTDVTIPDFLKRMHREVPADELTRKEVAGLGQQDVEALVRSLFPSEAELGNLTPEQLAKVKWVNKLHLGGINPDDMHHYGGGLATAGDLVNAAFRADLLYTRPAYALNLLQALGTNIIQQGVFTPLNLSRALRLGKTMGSEDQAILFELAGEGHAKAVTSGTKSTLHRPIETAANFWNRIIDRYPRVAAILHEMRRRGYKSDEQVHELLHNPELQDELLEITRRGRQEAVEFGEMSPMEQNILRRWIFFYPWLRASTLYSLRFPREHPYQAAAAVQTGRIGEEKYREAFGPYAERVPGAEGLVPLGGDEASSFVGMNTFVSPPEAIRAAASPLQGRRVPGTEGLAGMFGPAASAGYTLLTGKTTQGYELPGGTSPAEGALQELIGLSPQRQFAQRAKQPVRPARRPESEPLFPHGVGPAVTRMVGGQAAPLPVNKPALEARGIRNYRASLEPADRIKYDGRRDAAKANADAKILFNDGLLGSPTVPKRIRQAMVLRTQRQLAYLEEAKRIGIKQADLTAEDRARASVRVAQKYAKASRGAVLYLERILQQPLTEKQKAAVLARWWSQFGHGEALSEWSRRITLHENRVAARRG